MKIEVVRMQSLCMVFPVPARYFDDMIAACVQLRGFYQKASVHPLYVSTMKRAYYFENARGEYGEFERGDRFIIFRGNPADFSRAGLFLDSFPAAELLKEVEWEGTAFRLGIVTIDGALEKTLADLGVGINVYSENKWMQVEDYDGYISSPASRERLI